MGCDDSTTGPLAVRIEAVTATELSGTVGMAVTPAPTVRATDRIGRGLEGVPIAFETGDVGAAVASAWVRTDVRGLAAAGEWRLGSAAGTQVLTARAIGGSSTTFTALAQAGPVARIVRTAGAQLAPDGATLLTYLVVRVEDAFGNPVAGATVTFRLISGGGAIVGGDLKVTDALGLASLEAFMGWADIREVRVHSAGVEVAFPGPAFDSTLELLFVRDGYVTISRAGREARLTEGSQPAWSPDGRRIAFVSGAWPQRVYLMNADGSDIVPLIDAAGAADEPPDFHSPSWSPDGNRLVVATGDLYEGSIYVLGVHDDGEEPIVVQHMAAAPAWSPDGGKIAFVSLSGDDGYHALHVVDADGSDARDVTPRDHGGIDRPTWSPDGQRIAFAKCFDANCDIFTVSVDGSALTQLTHGGHAIDPTWSPDGAWIAFTSWSDWTSPTRTASIAIVPADTGGSPLTVIASGTFPAWRP
jgi:hypothetical protein